MNYEEIYILWKNVAKYKGYTRSMCSFVKDYYPFHIVKYKGIYDRYR